MNVLRDAGYARWEAASNQGVVALASLTTRPPEDAFVLDLLCSLPGTGCTTGVSAVCKGDNPALRRLFRFFVPFGVGPTSAEKVEGA